MPRASLLLRALDDEQRHTFTAPLQFKEKVRYERSVWKVADTMYYLATQNYKCALCNYRIERAEDAELEHDGKTRLVRGVVCPSCNDFVREYERTGKTPDLAFPYVSMYLSNPKT